MKRINQPLFFSSIKKNETWLEKKKKSMRKKCFYNVKDLSHFHWLSVFFPMAHLFYSPSPSHFCENCTCICSWNCLTVNLFSGINTLPGDLPFDWSFNSVVKILPISLTQSSFNLFVLKCCSGSMESEVHRSALWTSVLGNWLVLCLWVWREKNRGSTCNNLISAILGSIYSLHCTTQ